MKFLFVLRENELHWEQLMEKYIKKEGGEVVTVGSTEEAQGLLKDKHFKVDEIITGSFGSLEGPWKDVQKAALERSMGVTLLTGYPISDSQREGLEKQNVRILEKMSFDKGKFIAERFPAGSGAETR